MNFHSFGYDDQSPLLTTIRPFLNYATLQVVSVLNFYAPVTITSSYRNSSYVQKLYARVSKPFSLLERHIFNLSAFNLS